MPNKGYKPTQEHRDNLRKSHLGYIMTKSQKNNISIGVKNSLPKTSFKKGEHRSIETEIKKGQHFSSKTEFKRGDTMERCINWKGGISFEPYGLEFNKDLKEVIRNRDTRECQMCEKTELEEGRKLAVHHINYDKKNNDPKNLITLCNRCHLRTNWYRHYWEQFFINHLQWRK